MQAFLAFDHDKNGVVSMWELKRILDNFCFVLDKSELQVNAVQFILAYIPDLCLT